ncbi:N-acetylmuramoyl-L-alanine amidase [Fulvivirga sp. 29W222]|uniref:N-acetylmuramoyl-L-alanine amidase n=1 Tax=Fulvivirga marina TaxID=2494733 RepID=A0A937FVT9_9BACT|nr:N-acetylmuramoyl-L-alanine amidase [Fulvivirga marina]MBL6445221.1 N-acetylmuramoyl-L-alanine amidase [Fulvivirga marina]
MRQYFWVLILLFASLMAHAQYDQGRKVGANTRLWRTKVESEQLYSFAVEKATSVTIRYEGILEGAYIETAGKKYALSQDEHHQGKSNSTNLLIFDASISEFSFFTGAISGEIQIIVIDAERTKRVSGVPRLNEQYAKCGEPAMVDQSIWREGLPEPSYNRSFTVTENIIIHHSATSNEVSDYTNVVRNIYLYHTQGNGWSDIGYNYLIAPDGTIFKGRDPGNGDQDAVIGAHFCGRNSTTMGVCLMGTYTNISPSDEMLESLSLLLSWKADKGGLNPFATNSHPLNTALPVIAGHRDGCSTECPGQATYGRLVEVRNTTADAIEACSEKETAMFSIYPNPASSFFKVELVGGDDHRFELYDMRGQFFKIEPQQMHDEIATFSTGHLISGVYILHYQSADELIKRRLIVSN